MISSFSYCLVSKGSTRNTTNHFLLRFHCVDENAFSGWVSRLGDYVEIMTSLVLTPDEEAASLLQMHGGDPGLAECLRVLSSQFVIIQTRAQLMLTLATIVLTITGFSGPRIAASGLFARAAMAVGLVLTLTAVLLLLLNLRIRWLTQFRETSVHATLVSIIIYRDGKRKAYLGIICLLIAGLASYVAAVVAYLITGESLR